MLMTNQNFPCQLLLCDFSVLLMGCDGYEICPSNAWLNGGWRRREGLHSPSQGLQLVDSLWAYWDSHCEFPKVREEWFQCLEQGVLYDEDLKFPRECYLQSLQLYKQNKGLIMFLLCYIISLTSLATSHLMLLISTVQEKYNTSTNAVTYIILYFLLGILNKQKDKVNFNNVFYLSQCFKIDHILK